MPRKKKPTTDDPTTDGAKAPKKAPKVAPERAPPKRRSKPRMPDPEPNDAEAAEAAIADFYARIPEAIRELVRLFVVTDDEDVRSRLRGRIDALMDYVESDLDAGKPPARGGWQRFIAEMLNAAVPVLMQVQQMQAEEFATHQADFERILRRGWTTAPRVRLDDDDDEGDGGDGNLN